MSGVESPRPFLLMVDSGSHRDPSNRWFGSLDAALAAFEKMDAEHQRFAWIMERRTANHVVVLRDGARIQV